MTPLPPSPPPDRPDPALARVIRQLREERKLSPAGLAELSGVDGEALEQIESGAVDPPWATVEALAAALEVSVESIASAVVAQDPEQA